MTEEQIFKKRFPEYCAGEKCLSPYFDLFQIGFEEGENQNENLQEENARLKKESEENQDLVTIAYMQGASKNKAKLDEAKEIIKDFYESVKGNGTTCVNTGTRFINVLELVKRAEAFLKEE